MDTNTCPTCGATVTPPAAAGDVYTVGDLVRAAAEAVAPLNAGGRTLTGQTALAWALGVRPESVSRWTRPGMMPPGRVAQIAKLARWTLTTEQVFDLADGSAITR